MLARCTCNWNPPTFIKVSALFTYLLCAVSYASSLKLIAEDDARINNAEAKYLNKLVLFFGEELSVYDTTNGQFKNFDFDFNVNQDDGSQKVLLFSEPHLLDDHVYFNVAVNQVNIGLWRTNGTPEGTHLFSSQSLKELTIKNGFLMGLNAENDTWVSDGNSSYLHDIDVRKFGFSCVFAVDHIVFTDQFLPLSRSQQGTITEFDIPLFWTINPHFPVFYQTKKDCIIAATTIEDTVIERKFFRVPRIGTESLLTDIPLLSDITGFFAFNDRIIALKDDQMLRLTDDLKGFDASIDLPSNVGFSSIRMPQEGRSLFHINNFSKDTLYDFNRNQITEFDSNGYFFSGVKRTSDAEHFFHHVAPLSVQTKTGRLWLNATKTNQSYLDFEPDLSVDIINNPNQPKLYAQVTDDETQTSTFYQVVDDLDINSLITGTWHNPGIKNQGLNIRKGTRHNGSEYVMVFVVTYRGGQPLWLAGMAELDGPQQTVDMELREYDGINMFEANITPNQTVFGNLELQLTSCQTLRATITTANDQFELNLSRLDDMTFTQNCVD